MRRIYKYNLPPKPAQYSMLLPKGFRLLKFDWQGDAPTFWAEVDVAAPNVCRDFYLLFTGDEVPSVPVDYVGTTQSPNGLVWHLYHER